MSRVEIDFEDFVRALVEAGAGGAEGDIDDDDEDDDDDDIDDGADDEQNTFNDIVMSDRPIELARERGILIELVRDKNGQTLLFDCASNNVHTFIAAGIDVNAQDNEGNTALHIQTSRDLVLHTLLSSGADLNIKNNAGMTAAQVNPTLYKRLQRDRMERLMEEHVRLLKSIESHLSNRT